MSTFAVVVIVVGACIGVVASMLTRSVEPATDRAPDKRGRAVLQPALSPQRTVPVRERPLDGEPNTPTRWWQRLRSALVLGILAVGLGVLTAAAVGLVAVALFGVLRGAVG